jgi:hypothetical protein
MAYHSKTTFTFGPELRARLRQLRKRRGLTLRDLALLMDRRGPGSRTQLAKLERAIRTQVFNIGQPAGPRCALNGPGGGFCRLPRHSEAGR